VSIDFEVAGENWKVAGNLMRTAAPSKNKLGAFYGRGSGINGAKSCILGLSWHLISLLKLHFFVLFFSYIFFLHFSNYLHHCLFFAFWKSRPVNLVYIFVCSAPP
jgi:hypothetical protein